MIQKGSLAGKRVELCKDCTTIGRSRESDIFLEDVSVHRKQASILYVGAGYVLRDDHGSNDSFVNGEPVLEQLLKTGDVLAFGNTQITFYANEGTRPFQLPSSRGRELLMGKDFDPGSSVIACLQPATPKGLTSTGTGRLELRSSTTIGRSRECNIFLEDLSVSRVHATIQECAPSEYEIVDNRSASGTFINGKRILRHALKEGDSIQIGKSTFTFRLTRS